MARCGLDGEAGAAGPALGTLRRAEETAMGSLGQASGRGLKEENEFASWENKQGEDIQGKEPCSWVPQSGQGGGQGPDRVQCGRV